MSFTSCCYVNTWGIMHLCDVYNPNEKIINPMFFYSKMNWKDIKPYSKIYVNTFCLKDVYKCFIKPNLNVPIFLFSGHADMDTTLSDQATLNSILNDNNIVLWFSQNCVTDHPKCIKIPIGLDYHTLATIGHKRWGPKMSVTTQDALIDRIRNNNINRAKIMKCYANFHWNKDKIQYAHERRAAIEKISKDIVYYESSFVQRHDTWINQTEYWFVLSPPGNGLDCHRTWEALVLGCYPIIKRAAIDSMFDDLPVVIVDDWSDVTLELLTRKKEEFSKKQFNMNKLTMNYWKTFIDTRCRSIQDALVQHKP